MRLTGLIIAVLLAVTAGIFVISTPHTAASGERLTSAEILLDQVLEAHSHEGAVEGDQSSAHDHASAQKDCGDPASGAHGGDGVACCSMGACHAIQSIATPMVQLRRASAVVLAIVGDEQVEGVITGGLDRPPRTV